MFQEREMDAGYTAEHEIRTATVLADAARPCMDIVRLHILNRIEQTIHHPEEKSQTTPEFPYFSE